MRFLLIMIFFLLMIVLLYSEGDALMRHPCNHWNCLPFKSTATPVILLCVTIGAVIAAIDVDLRIS